MQQNKGAFFMNTNNSQKIGLPTAIIVGMNAMIGAGIFSVPLALGSTVGPAGLLTYAFVIIAVYFMGQSLSRLSQLYPQEGSFYTYTSKWAGHWGGLIAGGAYLAGLVIAMGLLVQITGFNLHYLFPQISPAILSIITLVILCGLNVIGARLSGAGQFILICCTIFPMIATSIICFMQGNFSNFFPFMPYGLMNVFTASRAVIFGFFGFEAAASLFNIVNNPKKNVPLALVTSIILVGLLYMTFVAAIIYAVPLHLLAITPSLASALEFVFPSHPWILKLIHFSVLSAILGTIHSMIWSSSELLLSYLKKIRIPALYNLINKGSLNQRIMVIIIGLAILLCFYTFKNIDLFFSLTASCIVFAFAASMITLLTLKSEWRSKQNIKTLIGLTTASIIFYFALEGIIKNI